MCQKSTGATAGCRLKYGTYLSPAETKIMCVISRGLDYDHVRFESVGGSASENARSIFEATTPTQRMIIDLECHRRCLLVEREAAIFGLNMMRKRRRKKLRGKLSGDSARVAFRHADSDTPLASRDTQSLEAHLSDTNEKHSQNKTNSHKS